MRFPLMVPSGKFVECSRERVPFDVKDEVWLTPDYL